VVLAVAQIVVVVTSSLGAAVHMPLSDDDCLVYPCAAPALVLALTLVIR